MRTIAIVFLLFLAHSATAQQRFHYPPAEAGSVVAHKDIEFKPGLLFDLYRPAGMATVPVVIFANVGSPNYRGWPVYIGWGEAVAKGGMAGVIYQATQAGATEDFDALIAALRTRAGELKIDPSRVVVWSASANVRIGLPLLMDQTRTYIRGGVVYYGDAEISTIRTDLPVLFVRAGLDTPALNDRLDKLIARGLEANAPWTVENYAGGLHGFEVLNDTEITRALIHRTVSFMKLATRPEIHAAYVAAGEDAAIGAAFTRGDWPAAIEGYRRAVAARPSEGDLHLRLGIALLRSKQFEAALPSIEKAWELGRRGPRDVALPAAEAAAGARNVERAVHWLDTLLSTPFGPPTAELRTAESFAPIRNEAAFVQLLDSIDEQARIVSGLESGSPAEALRTLRTAKHGRLTREPVLLGMAYALLGRGRAAEAVEVFRMATTRYPQSANAWESLSEAYEAAGQTALAIEASRKALAVIGGDESLTGNARDNVRRAAEQRLARLEAKS